MADPVARLERALADKEYAISSYADKIQQYDDEITAIHTETNQNDDEIKALQQQQQQHDKNPKNINAEDAFDTIIRLESTAKIVDKRNAVLEKDNLAFTKAFRDVGKLLEKYQTEEQRLVSATGYHPEQHAETCETETLRENSDKAQAMEAAINKELVAADVVIKKKRNLISDLTQKVQEQKAKENALVQIYNDIRVTDRDVKEAAKSLEAVKADYGKIETALVASAENNGREVAVKSLQGDREFLKEEIRKHKTDKARQEKVMAAQLSRTKFLQDRLDVVMAAIKDMRLEKDLERSVSKDLVATSSANPEDPDRILPANETIAIEIYELLHRDYEAMRSIADRKAILVTEKTCTTDAQVSTIMMYSGQMEMTTKQQDQTRVNNKLEQHEAVIEVTRLVEEFRRELAKLVNENARLKGILQEQTQNRRNTSGQEVIY
eukprot:GILI01012055.1.p1 GENE.GILI01012055.1~~GILI01012055.1.p1  ORF type:complete len:437 (-),score=162.28 GILI01012055.1:199-1509(-)